MRKQEDSVGVEERKEQRGALAGALDSENLQPSPAYRIEKNGPRSAIAPPFMPAHVKWYTTEQESLTIVSKSVIIQFHRNKAGCAR